MYEHLGTSEEDCLISKSAIFSRKRKHFAENEKEILMKSFQASVCGYAETKEIDQLAEILNVSKKTIQNWFSSQRRVLKRAGLLPQSE